LGLVVATVASPCFAGLLVDGSLSDWGVVVADRNASVLSFAPGLNVLAYDVEDQNDDAGISAYLGPNYGGQDYDAELLAVAFDEGKLFIALVTGQRPDNGFKLFAPGDLRFATSEGVYGLEIGGGPGGGDGSLLLEGAPGSTYTLYSDGQTSGHAWADPAQTTGSLWRNVGWINDAIPPAGPTQLKIDSASACVGMADYVYTRNVYTKQHAVIELSLDIGLFNGAVIDTISWRPSCGNDELDAPVRSVPEPGSIALMLSGGLLLWRRSRGR